MTRDATGPLTFPSIVRADMRTGDGKADEVAARWREMGYTVRVLPRTLRAMGVAVVLDVVILTGRRAAKAEM